MACCGPSDFEKRLPSNVVDYEAVIPFKHRLLEKAWTNFKAGERKDLRPAYEEFCAAQAHWLEDYALFRSLKEKFQDAYYLDWPAELVERRPAALAPARRDWPIESIRSVSLSSCCSVKRIALKEYAHAKGVQLDWRPAVLRIPGFQRCLGQSGIVFAGRTPPPALRRRGSTGLFQRRRDSCGATLFTIGMPFGDRLWHGASTDYVHFWIMSTSFGWITSAGFAAAWHVPAGAPTAQSGQWVPGPGPSSSGSAKRAGRPTVHRRRSGY